MQYNAKFYRHSVGFKEILTLSCEKITVLQNV